MYYSRKRHNDQNQTKAVISRNILQRFIYWNYQIRDFEILGETGRWGGWGLVVAGMIF